MVQWHLLSLVVLQSADAVFIGPDRFEHFERTFLDAALSQGDEPTLSEMRLPKSVEPISYNLTIRVFLPDYGTVIEDGKKFTFQGRVHIAIKNKEPVEEIVLNQRNLAILHIKFVEQNGETRNVDGNPDDRLQRLTIHTGHLSAGEYSLEIDFSGKMSTNGFGLFLSEHNLTDKETGRMRFAAATQMEPDAARRMVPCFDEPDFKATWDVRIIHPKDSQAVANGKEIETVNRNGGWKMTSFETTPPMSSYLLAIGVFNFTIYEGHTKRGTRVRVYASPTQTGIGIALEQSIQVIEGFEKYFQYEIPLRKMDMVAIENFNFGGMENWGLIYYTPGQLLGGKYPAAETIAHEVAHQWFGNLVTTKWWEQVYLNEGFATLMAWKGLEFIERGKYVNKIPLRGHLEVVFWAEARTKQPIVTKLHTPNEIVRYGFSSGITYRKGAVVLNMIKKVMGDEAFEQAIRSYLRKYAYQNVWQEDLFSELDKTIPENRLGPDGKRLNISHFAYQWTMQREFPFVTLGESNSTHCEVTQRRYPGVAGGADTRYANNPYGYKWDIPVWIQRETRNDREFYWLPANDKLFIPCIQNEFIVLNPDSYAYFKTDQGPLSE